MATLETSARNTMCDALCGLLDGGDIKVITSGSNEIGVLGFSTPAFADASNGTAVANTISDDTSAHAGTIASAQLRSSAEAVVLTATCSVSGGGGDITWTSLTVGEGDTLKISSLSITVPA